MCLFHVEEKLTKHFHFDLSGQEQAQVQILYFCLMPSICLKLMDSVFFFLKCIYVCLYLSAWCLMVFVAFSGYCPNRGLYSNLWTTQKASSGEGMRETLQKCLTKFYKDLGYLPQLTSKHYTHINQAVSVCCLQHLWWLFGCLYEVTFYPFF